MSASRKRDGRKLTDAEVEAADEWHWVSIGEATRKLLARLSEHHGTKNAAGNEPAASNQPQKRKRTGRGTKGRAL
jgi:hypothetical protein